MSSSSEIKQFASFRDPSGYMFLKNGLNYRFVSQSYKLNYDLLLSTGLYNKLVQEKYLLAHEEIAIPENSDAFKILLPQQIPFISYPYEWCFSQLKDAALLTLKIQAMALQHGMCLKDASAFNIQFLDGNPILVDTLSFEKYEEGAPWQAYGQFCRHFLAPLALMSKCDVRLGQLSRIHLDGIPLALASSLLPLSTRMNPTLLSSIHLHARSEKKYEKQKSTRVKGKISKQALLALIQMLQSGIQSLNWKPKGTEWAEYYEDNNYSKDAFQNKKAKITDYILRSKPKRILDIGANTGYFSRLGSQEKILTLSSDSDPAAVELNYLDLKKSKSNYLLPLLIDVCNPSPGIGWENLERPSFVDRVESDLVLMLAIIHHLAISNHIPFDKIAKTTAKLCKHLIIEFVPDSDSQVQWLINGREDTFSHYTRLNFENEFSKYFEILDSYKIVGSERVLFFMQKRAL